MHTLTLACIGANGPFGSPLCHLDSRQQLQSQPSCAPSQYHCFHIGALPAKALVHIWLIHVPSRAVLSCVSRQFLPLLLGLPLREFRTPRPELPVSTQNAASLPRHPLYFTYSFSPDYMFWRAFGCLPVISLPRISIGRRRGPNFGKF